MATVYLKSQSGRSLLSENNTAPLDPGLYLPSPEIAGKAIAALQALGFRIEAQGITLSISGPPELFEKTCGVEISPGEKTVYRHGKTELRKLIKSSQPVMHIQSLESLIEGIVISIPGIPLDDSYLKDKNR
jgi:hypothetical protein